MCVCVLIAVVCSVPVVLFVLLAKCVPLVPACSAAKLASPTALELASTCKLTLLTGDSAVAFVLFFAWSGLFCLLRVADENNAADLAQQCVCPTFSVLLLSAHSPATLACLNVLAPVSIPSMETRITA